MLHDKSQQPRKHGKAGTVDKKHGTAHTLTNNNRVVISNEQLAVDIDELGDQVPLQLCVCSQATKRYVIYPLIANCKSERKYENQHDHVQQRHTNVD